MGKKNIVKGNHSKNCELKKTCEQNIKFASLLLLSNVQRQTHSAYLINYNVTNSLKWLQQTCSDKRFFHGGTQWLMKCTTEFTSQVTLTLIALNLDGSLSAKCLRTCLAAKPNEHKPCRMGALKPDQRAFLSTARLSINEIKTHNMTQNPSGKRLSPDQ